VTWLCILFRKVGQGRQQRTAWLGAAVFGDVPPQSWKEVLKTGQICQEAWRVFPIRISSHHIRYNQSIVFFNNY